MVSSNDRWILPEGIEEALPDDAFWLESVRRRLIDLYQSWGYQLVMPPFIEYLESLLTCNDDNLDVHTFKLTDQLNGRMMGVRADMTPQVARIDAHRLKREAPNRFCYLGTVLTTRPAGFGGTRSPLQVGAELYGHHGFASDLEIISLMLETLDVCGVESIHVDLGHVGIFRAVAEKSGLADTEIDILFDMIQRKAIPEIKAFVVNLDQSAEVTQGLVDLSMLNGGAETLERARETLAFAGEEVLAYIDSLVQLEISLRRDYPAVKINFDLAELRGFHYETGVVFAVFVPGEGQEIARGGRYDGIGKDFGRARPAVGFSTDLKTLRRISCLEFEQAGRTIFAPNESDKALKEVVLELRRQGDSVIYSLEKNDTDASVQDCSHRLININGQWTVEEMK
jgi:ATP phosphoribosyltransferase regulatory subunit